VVLVHFTRRRKDLPFSWMFGLFALFIVGCGATHLMEVVTTYVPLYRLAGLVKVVTAVASLGTAILLVPLVPRALALRSPRQLEQANADLERRVAERTAALRQSEGEYRQTFEMSAVGMAQVRPDGRFRRVNHRLCDIVGYSCEELTARTFQDLTHPEDLGPDLAQVRRCLAGEIDTYALEKRYVRKDGRVVWVHLTVSLARLPSGEPDYFISVVEDISRRKELEQQVRRHAAELERRVEERTGELQEANGALEAFGYSVSHDLRTPLRNMQSLAQALEEDYGDRLDAGGRDFCRRITAAAGKMDTLINDLLAYSRLSRADLPLGRVDLGGVLADARSALAETIRDSRAEVTVEGPLPVVYGHRATLVQVVTNLLANALKFVAPGVRPEVRVRAEERDGFVRLWVEDNGIGIAPPHQSRIFKVFERLHGEERYPGTGIGLAIVRKGVERTGGRVGVESEVGRGSRFWVELPRRGGRP
jgi:PAS domain S-box-containing protein